MTRALAACPWIWASGPTALILSPSIKIPTLGWTVADRPSTRRPALISTTWGACALTDGRATRPTHSRMKPRIEELRSEGGRGGAGARQIYHHRNGGVHARPRDLQMRHVLRPQG